MEMRNEEEINWRKGIDVGEKMYLYGGIIMRRIRNDRSNVKGVSE